MSRMDDLAVLTLAQTDDCVLWPYGLQTGGYGSVRTSSGVRCCHRVVCEQFHGACPDGLEAAHSCGVSSCVNPRHLRWVTPKENAKDRDRHTTTARGSRIGRSKLVEADVLQIRSLWESGGHSQPVLAARFGVAERQIRRILSRQHWRHI